MISIKWEIRLNLKSLSTGAEWQELSHVNALTKEQAIEIASLRASRAHGRVIVTSIDYVIPINR